MKLILPLLLLAVCIASAQNQASAIKHRAQQLSAESTKAEQAHTQQAVGTNVIRLVNGQAYNIARSTNWVTLPPPSFNSKGTPLRVMRITTLRVAAVLNATELACEQVSHVGDTPGGSTYFIVKNFPEGAKLVTGSPLPEMRVMRIGSRSLYGQTVAVYDYGLSPQPAAAPR